MIGTKLVPLSKLKDYSKSEYNKNNEKYIGRSNLKQKEILLLDCNWDDVVFFSMLDPRIIFAALELLGLLDKKKNIILKFPIKVLKNKTFCSYQECKDKEIFKKINIHSYKELHEIPIDTIQYFIDCVKSGEDPLIFSNIPHLLLKDELSISLGEEIEYKSISYFK